MSGQKEFEQMFARLDEALGAHEFESESESQAEFLEMCKPQLILDRFELGDYRLYPHHYGPLPQFLQQVRDNPILPNTAIYVQSHADAGNEIMNSGLARAFEVQRFIRDLAEKTTFEKLHLIPIRTGSSGKWSPISLTLLRTEESS